MHQAILTARRAQRRDHREVPLRFLRSSSASLPGPVMEQLAETFGAPVIEGYGMTEAAHQMARTRCRRARRSPAPWASRPGPRCASPMRPRTGCRRAVGEVVISGPNVTPGYEGNPEANAKNFFEAEGKRWFRTGDQGAFRREGYLTLTGRLKEIINRGGEKVSPLEVDGVLSAHPAVAQVVTFACRIPSWARRWRRRWCCARAEADEASIRAFAAERLADFKVPRKVVILDEIPKGATGKLQRIGLAEKLGLVEGA
jgi:acyl-CoA synthetase (AMP-forming)/AMP-acid ligase II